MKKFPAVISFVGLHNSGKTTLLTKIIPRLEKKGLRIGVVKHTHHHDFEIDRQGKDSYELRKAGAEAVLVASRQKIAFIQNHKPPAWQKLIHLFRGVDMLLVEGDKHSSLPKIEVYRRILNQKPIYPKLKRVIAVCSDTVLRTRLKQFSIENPKTIADSLLKQVKHHG